jgi:hypothetical protein
MMPRAQAAAWPLSGWPQNENVSNSAPSRFHQEVNALQYSEYGNSMKPAPNVTGARSLLNKAFTEIANILSHVDLTANY